MHWYTLRAIQLESSFMEMDLIVLVDAKRNMRQQYILVARKFNIFGLC